MNYNRYLDLHLCSVYSTNDANKQKPFFTHGGTKYRYDFMDDIQEQAKYRLGKAEGVSRENARVLNHSELTQTQESFLQPTAQGGISDELSRLRYVGCLVSIARLKDGQTYPQLKSLVAWISDDTTINKLRINCHGLGTSQGGFAMGSQISPEDFVASLVRHGLHRDRREQAFMNPAGLAHAARWKSDNEVNACDNEKCKKQFTVLRRRHHCRRCGGIFCDACSSWKVDLAVALTGENNATAKNVKNARVCEQCHTDVMAFETANVIGGKVSGPRKEKFRLRDVDNSLVRDKFVPRPATKYGLQQITLGLCLGAKSDDDFSPEVGRATSQANAPPQHNGFTADSLAGRLLVALTDQGLRGIKVTASNQIVSGTTGEIKNVLEVKYPRGKQAAKSPGKANFQKPSFDFPAVVWGESGALERQWDDRKQRDRLNLPTSSEIALHPTNSRSLIFGACRCGTTAYEWLKTAFLSQWRFGGWTGRKETIYSAPSSTSRGLRETHCLTPPPRVTSIEVKPNSKNEMRVFLTGRVGVESFKDYKSYGVS